MFTEGLDKNAVRWVREGTTGNQRETPISVLNQRSRLGPLGNLRNGGRGCFRLPPTSKFRSGHLPSVVIPVSRAIPVNGVDSELGSDMDTDSEDEIYGGRYSLESLPQSNVEQRYNVTRQPQYVSDSEYSEISSSREVLGRQQRIGQKGVVGGGGGRYPAGRHDLVEDGEWTESAMSSEYASTQVGSNNMSVHHRGAYVSDGYSSGVPSRANVVILDKKAKAIARNEKNNQKNVVKKTQF